MHNHLAVPLVLLMAQQGICVVNQETSNLSQEDYTRNLPSIKQVFAEFLTSFWSLNMYDLHVSEQLYEKEIKKLKEAPSKLHRAVQEGEGRMVPLEGGKVGDFNYLEHCLQYFYCQVRQK